MNMSDQPRGEIPAQNGQEDMKTDEKLLEKIGLYKKEVLAALDIVSKNAEAAHKPGIKPAEQRCLESYNHALGYMGNEVVWNDYGGDDQPAQWYKREKIAFYDETSQGCAWVMTMLDDIKDASRIAAHPNEKSDYSINSWEHTRRNFSPRSVIEGNVAIDLQEMQILSKPSLDALLKVLGTDPVKDQLPANTPELKLYWENTRNPGGRIRGSQDQYCDHATLGYEQKDLEERMVDGEVQFLRTEIPGLILRLDHSLIGGRTPSLGGFYLLQDRVQKIKH